MDYNSNSEILEKLRQKQNARRGNTWDVTPRRDTRGLGNRVSIISNAETTVENPNEAIQNAGGSFQNNRQNAGGGFGNNRQNAGGSLAEQNRQVLNWLDVNQNNSQQTWAQAETSNEPYISVTDRFNPTPNVPEEFRALPTEYNLNAGNFSGVASFDTVPMSPVGNITPGENFAINNVAVNDVATGNVASNDVVMNNVASGTPDFNPALLKEENKRLSPKSISEVEKLEKTLDQSHDIAAFYDAVRNSSDKYLDNSFGRKVGQE